MSRTVRSFALIVLMVFCGKGFAQGQAVDITKQMGIDQKLGVMVPPEIEMIDEGGNRIQFGELYGTRPLVVLPIFYRCQTGCALQLHNIMKVLIKMKDTYPVGKDFDMVLVSIHPKETPELALAKKVELLKDYDLADSKEGWHCLVTSGDSIKQLTDLVGFRYSYNEEKDLINHATCAIFLTPDGQISSYMYGVDYPTKVFQENVGRAAKYEVGPKAEVFLFGCIMRDPVTGRLSLVVNQALKVTGIATLLILGCGIGVMLRRDKTKNDKDSNSEGGDSSEA